MGGLGLMLFSGGGGGLRDAGPVRVDNWKRNKPITE